MMGPLELMKQEIEREERGAIMMEFQRMFESSGDIPVGDFPLDRLRSQLEVIGSYLLGFFFGTMSLFVLYLVIQLMR
jgi:hypothetical protein